MKNITTYLIESKVGSEINSYLSNQVTYYADTICLSLAFIDFFKLLLNNESDEIILKHMEDISNFVGDYSSNLPRSMTKYGYSSTNVTVSDWNYLVINCIYPDKKSDKNYEKTITKEIAPTNKEFMAFGTTYNIVGLKKILDLFKNAELTASDYKNFIKYENETISNIKKRWAEFVKETKENYK